MGFRGSHSVLVASNARRTVLSHVFVHRYPSALVLSNVSAREGGSGKQVTSPTVAAAATRQDSD